MSKMEESQGYSMKLEVNVTKIVRYVCIAGVLIVGIIFGTHCYQKISTSEQK